MKKDGTETSFKEVLDAEKSKLLQSFYLKDGDRIIGIDLTNGRFYINGMWLDPLPDIKGTNYRLVFYKRMEGVMGRGQAHIAKYLVGWQTTVKGTNHQRIMFLDASDNTITIKSVR